LFLLAISSFRVLHFCFSCHLALLASAKEKPTNILTHCFYSYQFFRSCNALRLIYIYIYNKSYFFIFICLSFYLLIIIFILFLTYLITKPRQCSDICLTGVNLLCVIQYVFIVVSMRRIAIITVSI